MSALELQTLKLDIQVQACGCIAIPDSVTASLRIGPGTHLELTADPALRTFTLRALSPELDPASPSARTACPIDPTHP